jgi:ankyrin repeat protein
MKFALQTRAIRKSGNHMPHSKTLTRFQSCFGIPPGLGVRHAIAAFVLSFTLLAKAAAPLADAVEKQNHSAIKSLLHSHADLNAPQIDGTTALHWAAYLDDVETAKALIKAGADVKATNHYNVSALSMACVNGNTELVELLLNAGADPNTKLNGGETALMTAARTGRIGPVKALLARGADVNAKERKGQTAIMWAAAEGNTEVVDLLLKSGAEFKTPLENGFTPFLFAVREGRLDTVKLLLKAGADVNEPMHPKRPNGKNVRPNTSALIVAIENGHFEVANALLEAGADPNDQRSGYTALHTITWERKPPSGDGDDGVPPPIGSGKMTSLEFVRKLVEHGADVNLQLAAGSGGKGVLTHKGMTPFMMACYTADIPLMKLLVELGADPLKKNADDSTTLMAAAGLGALAPPEESGSEDECLEAVDYLLSKGADINAVDKNGETAMHGAAYKMYPRVVELLAKRGAKIEIWNQKDKWGWTPLRIAQGYRPGNFRPSPETTAAIESVMLAAGVKPPDEDKTVARGGDEYASDAAKAKSTTTVAPK